jgi:hypothetical protein
MSDVVETLNRLLEAWESNFQTLREVDPDEAEGLWEQINAVREVLAENERLRERGAEWVRVVKKIGGRWEKDPYGACREILDRMGGDDDRHP